MEIDSGTSASSYTILRIKRKRNEEPLDALVVESRVRKKKSRGGIGVFQFAQTVEHDAWQDEGRQKDIQEQISRLARETEASAELISPLNQKAASPHARQQREDANRRYTILEAEKEQQKDLPHPPKVVSAKELQAKKPDFKMYDAILASEKSVLSVPVDSEMEKFLPMLNDYLRLHDLPTASSSASLASSEKSGPEDYVWDVFYHRPTTLSEWNEAAKVGTLTGLPPSITDPYDSDSSEEEEDEADEDSNAEEYYKNDYPEDEPSSDSDDGSDAFHDDSDQEDAVHYDDDGDDHEWR